MEGTVFTKLAEIFEKKAVKYSLLAMSIIGFLVCILITLPQIQKNILYFAETMILKRELRDISKWEYQLIYTGVKLSALFIILCYFCIRKKIILSFIFSLITFSLYFSLYLFFRFSYDYYSIIYFPLFVLLLIIFLHLYFNQDYFLIKNKINKIICILSSNRYLNSSLFIFTSGSVLGIIFFIYIFGTAVLDFSYTAWLMSGGDLTQHYLGWRFFRSSAWYFPLGLIDNIVYPFKISIFYTDSIPIFAVFFKILSPVLPHNFQYFGLFGIICYALQGGIGTLIVKKIGGNTIQSIIGAIFFIFSTVMMYRIYGHTSLSAHFIILLSIYVCLHKNNDIKKEIFSWSSLLVLSVGIHIYFASMVLIFMLFRQLDEYLTTRNLKNNALLSDQRSLHWQEQCFLWVRFTSLKTQERKDLGITAQILIPFLTLNQHHVL